MEKSGDQKKIDQGIKIGELPLDLKAVAALPEGKTTITGASGDALRVRVTTEQIAIDGPFSENHFHADMIKDEKGERYITFSIFSKIRGSEERHSDFHAGELADAALTYFNTLHDIRGIQFEWQSYSDNQKTYLAVKKATMDELVASGMPINQAEERAKEQAARATWTGRRLAQPHGFSTVNVHERQEVIDEETGPELIVFGTFSKPSE